MLTGRRGKIGRAMPEAIIRRLVDFALFDGSSRLSTIADLRSQNDLTTTTIADEIGVKYVKDPASGTFCVESDDWAQLNFEFRLKGLVSQQIQGQFSYAAQTVWSIGEKVSSFATQNADLRGAAAIWQVFPGRIEPFADAQDFSGRVDAVYTWVDSSDKSWRTSYRETLRKNGETPSESSAGIARFTSRDELLFSLRSLEMNVPWIDRVFLVTAGQRPSWLAEGHPKLVMVNHSDIFADTKTCLPTFNSHAIESQLANIRGLKEHFLYVNDDVFFGRPLHPNTFFGPDGQSKYALSDRHFAAESSSTLEVNQAAANNRNLVVDRFDRTTSRKFKHVAHPQRLTVHRRIHEEYADLVSEISRHKFRHEDDLSIPSSLAHQFAARMGFGYPASIDYQYIDIGADTFYLDILRFVRMRNPEMFCINEVFSNDDETNRGTTVRRLLENKFPLKSSFEK